jgi:hypothetical protein
MTRCSDDDVCGHLIIVVVGLKITIIATTKLKSNMDDEKKNDCVTIFLLCLVGWSGWLEELLGKTSAKTNIMVQGYPFFIGTIVKYYSGV